MLRTKMCSDCTLYVAMIGVRKRIAKQTHHDGRLNWDATFKQNITLKKLISVIKLGMPYYGWIFVSKMLDNS
jgi:hypothetical protein